VRSSLYTALLRHPCYILLTDTTAKAGLHCTVIVANEIGSNPPELTAAPRRRSFPHWLLEGLFIVISVMLGFAVAQFGEYRNNRELAARMLASIRAEIESNIALLEPMVPIHSKWADALRSVDTSNAAQSGLDLFFATRPALPGKTSPFPVLRRSAWDAAVSSGALRLLDYSVAEALSEVYAVQAIATGNVDRLSNAFHSTAPFDPAARVAAARMLWLTIEDIQHAEAALLELYRKHLPAIRAAAAAQR
jgi:hypothetical protein